MNQKKVSQYTQTGKYPSSHSEIIKDTFGISVLHVRGFENVRSVVLVCVLVYQLMVYYNCVTKQENPRIVKRMLCN
jgi:hypothetical protein